MRTIYFRCADTAKPLAALQVDDKTFNDETIDIFTGPMANAKVHGRLEGVTRVQVAESSDESCKFDDLDWIDLPSSYL